MLGFGEIPLICIFLAAACAAGFGFQAPVVPVVDAHLGGCSAAFTVVDKDQVPVYDAKIDVSFRYGFLGLRKMSLQVGTNSDGRARVAGLPEGSGKTFLFAVTSGTLSQNVEMHASDKCDAVFDVKLTE
jgi:hypothetical protein